MLQCVTKQRLQAGKVVIGTNLNFASPRLIEIFGWAGLHYVIIDCEHGALNPETVEGMIRAAECSGVTPIVRPARNDPSLVLQYLDMGAQGVMVPGIATRADAEAIVAAAKFHPEGLRSLAAFARWARGGTGVPLPEAIRLANQNTLLVAMIQSMEGVRNAAEIAAVPGIDVVCAAHSDLSQALGIPGQLCNPDIEAAVEAVGDAAVAAGKATGAAMRGPQQIPSLRERGRLFLGVTLPVVIAGTLRPLLDAAE